MLRLTTQPTAATPVWSILTDGLPDRPALVQAKPLEGLAVVDVVVIGAGMVGLAAAFEAVQRGQSTIVLEAGPIGGAATLGSAGVIETSGKTSFSQTGSGQGSALERLAALRREGLAASGAAALRALDPTQHIHDAINIPHVVNRLAESIVDGGSRLAPFSRAIGFGNVGGETWVVSTDRARVSGRALIVATGAMVPAPETFGPQLGTAFNPAVRWTFASAIGSAEAMAPSFGGRVMRQTVRGVEQTIHIDGSGRLVVGGIAAETEAAARSVLNRLFATTLGGVALPQFNHVTRSVVAATQDGAAQIHRLGPSGYAVIAPEADGLAVGYALGKAVCAAAIPNSNGHAALPVPIYVAPERPALRLTRRLGVFSFMS